MAVIATAFPGLFNYKFLLNLDYRDFLFWFREALKKNILDHIGQIQAVRIAMSTNEGYSRTISELRMHLRTLDIGKEKAVKESWESLKQME